jgi:hypothetical protein
MDNIDARIKRIYKENTLATYVNDYYGVTDETLKKEIYEKIKTLIIELYGI